jgi:cell division protein FtsQ
MDAEAYPPEVLSDDEPRYLRRQKPLEIKRRKFGRKAWITYLRVAGWSAVGAAGLWAAYASAHYLLTARGMALLRPEQVEISVTQFVPRARVLEIFAADRGHSVLRIPIEVRRRQLESIPWVEQATVRRALPNRIQIEIVERTPIAFLRQGSDMALVDAHGVILAPPVKANFHFPVVTGISADMAMDDRERRMQMYAALTQQLDAARSGALDQVSEVDLADAGDLRTTLTVGANEAAGARGAGSAADAAWGDANVPILVHFGDGDFENKYRTLVDNIGKWRATAGRVDSVDLRFSGEAVVNPDATPTSLKAKPEATDASSAPPARAPSTAKHSSTAHKQRTARRNG